MFNAAVGERKEESAIVGPKLAQLPLACSHGCPSCRLTALLHNCPSSWASVFQHAACHAQATVWHAKNVALHTSRIFSCPTYAHSIVNF